MTGHVIAIGERDCSIQRRHQKLVEEAPAPGLSRDERRELHAMAVRVATAAGLTNAATAEFLRAPDGTLAFLEVNTRLQVEHGVTELVSGVDIVQEQFGLAAGRPLSAAALAAATRAELPDRHAIEVRLTAEDPARSFAPTPGRVTTWSMPTGTGIRVDTGLQSGDRVPPEYDNLMAKILAVASDRLAAIEGLRQALDETRVGGLQTTLPFHRFVVRHAGFQAGGVSTDWVAEAWDGAGERAAVEARAASAAAALGPAPRGAEPAARPGPTTSADPDGPTDPAGPTDPDGPADRPSGWLAAARDEAIDRWPR